MVIAFELADRMAKVRTARFTGGPLAGGWVPATLRGQGGDLNRPLGGLPGGSRFRVSNATCLESE